MTGFDPTYRNIVDYIVRITYRIWEPENSRDVDYILDTYSPTSRVYDDYGLQLGNEKIVKDTYSTTAAFPNIMLDAEEVIWAGNEDIGFHTSHLVRITGTNTGPGKYSSEPTGREINVPVIANCVSKGNDIFLEHVLYNTGAMLQQLGLDVWEEAEKMVSNPPAGWPRTPEIWNQLRNAISPEKPLSDAEPVTKAQFDPDAFARRVHESIWNMNLESSAVLSLNYVQNFPFEGAGNRKFTGKDRYWEYVSSIRRAFPDLKLQVDEVYWMGNEEEHFLISTRWSAEGTHSGDGPLYREATNAACQIWGITQWRVERSKIVQEAQLFNEFDLMLQITKARLDAAVA